MKKISQILDQIKERISNPLIFSFIISWIFWNWEITVALLWYDPPKINQGHLSLIEYIECKTTTGRSIIYPLLFAIGYTFVFPFLKITISAFQTKLSKLSDEWNLSILKDSMVPIDKYLSFKKEYEKRSAVLEKAILDESSTQKELEASKTALLEEQTKQNEISKQLSEAKSIIQSFNNIGFISGKWIRIVKRGTEIRKENIEIRNNNMYVYNGNMMEQKYSIHNFYYDVNSKRIGFTLFHFDRRDYNFFSVNELTHRHKELVGTEYGTEYSTEVSYSKDDESLEDNFEFNEEEQEVTDRNYWIKRATKDTVKLADEVLSIINSIKPSHNLKYNKFYIGLSKNGQPNNFAIFRPKKNYMRLEIRLPKSERVDEFIRDTQLAIMDYDDTWRRYRIRLSGGDVQKHEKALKTLLDLAE